MGVTRSAAATLAGALALSVATATPASAAGSRDWCLANVVAPEYSASAMFTRSGAAVLVDRTGNSGVRHGVEVRMLGEVYNAPAASRSARKNAGVAVTTRAKRVVARVTWRLPQTPDYTCTLVLSTPYSR